MNTSYFYDHEKFISRWVNENRPYSDELGDGNFLNWLKKYDPTARNKYVKWMSMRYLAGDIKRLEDIPSRISNALKTYQALQNKNKLKPEHKVINQIRDIEEVIEQYQEVDTTSKNGVGDKLIVDGEAELVFNDDEIRIVVPKTLKASQHFGRNTRWCTTSDDNTFKSYSKNGPLYIVLHKSTNKRWQFHFESNQFMDEKDQSINLYKFLEEFDKPYQMFNKIGYVEWVFE